MELEGYKIKRRNILQKTTEKYNGNIRQFRTTPYHGEYAPMCKLTEVQVLEIIKLLNKNFADKDIAVIYNVSRENISRIRHGRNWKHLFYLIKCTNSNKQNLLSYDIVNEIKDLKDKLTITEIATKLNLKYRVIYNIINDKTYKYETK